MRPSTFRPQTRQIDKSTLTIVLRAYALGYLTTTGPRILSFVRILWKQDVSNRDKATHLWRILCRAFKWTSFPTFCAFLVGSSAVVEVCLRRVLASLLRSRNCVQTLRVNEFIRFTAILCSSFVCFPLINSRRCRESHPNVIREQPREGETPSTSVVAGKGDPQRPAPPEFAGRTLDLTLFATTRAADVLACLFWKRWKSYRKSHNKWTYVESVTPQLGDAGLFAASAAMVMWAWFYLPERLPYSYGRWIGEAAQVDSRLIEALRSCRRGEWVYGKPKGDRLVLEPMCQDYGWPEEWGDTSKTVPIPCEMVHMGCGPSCEKHAIWRFVKAFTFACFTYFPVQLMLQWRSRSIKAYMNAAAAALRSSTFLGLFVSLFYYSVCLARTRLGPKLVNSNRVTPTMWDSGLCVGVGCMLCGWSILIESARKRREIALFVAPRAAATVLPRVYNRKYLWRENAVFALSTAVVLTSIQKNPKMVRGMLGKILGRVYK